MRVKKISFSTNKQSGQILVLVLLVVVVVLAVGLSVASRNLTNLKTSSQAEQSQRAFTAAEGGVEDVLAKLNGVANLMAQPGTPPETNNCTKDNSENATCELPGSDTTVVGDIKVKAARSYEKLVEPGDVGQINLTKPDGTGWTGDLLIEWIKTGDSTQSTLEFIFVCQGGTVCIDASFTGSYGQKRDAKTGQVIAGQAPEIATCTLGAAPFSCKQTYTLGVNNVRILRLKPFWNRTTIKVSPPVGDTTFPIQTYEITSTATTDTGVSRKVEVKRDVLPQLPAIFDYALYSGGDIIK